MTVTATELEEGAILYLHFSDNTPSDEEKITLADGSEATVIWKDVLVAGEYPMTPTQAGAVERTLTVIAEGESSREQNIIAMSDLIESHKDGAFKYVTIPTSHKDGVLDNTGYVPQPTGLRVVEKNDSTVMQAALGFTEPDVKGKVQRGTIPDVSVGIFFNWLNKHKNKLYRAAMKHVALTPTPFMGNLTPFKPVFAADDDFAENTPIYHFALNEDTTNSTSSDGGGASDSTGDVLWDESMGFNWVRQRIEEQLNPTPDAGSDGEVMPIRRPSYYVQDISDVVALVSEFYKGDSTRFLIPYKRGDNGVEVAPTIRWVEVKEAMIAASDDTTDDNFEELSVDTLREKLGSVLSAQLGDHASGYKIDAISLDKRVRIKSTTDDSTWTAPFALVGGEVFMASKWNKVEALSADVTPPASAPVPEPQVSIAASDPLTAQVEAARQRRAALLSSSH